MARGLIVLAALIGIVLAVPELAHASATGSKPEVPSGPVYIAMDPITVPVIRGGKVRGRLVLGVNLVADGPKAGGDRAQSAAAARRLCQIPVAQRLARAERQVRVSQDQGEAASDCRQDLRCR